MNYKDLTEAICELDKLAYNVETILDENGGELTEEVENMMNAQDALAELVQGEGVDMLGRWLKSIDDREATYKAEKKYCEAKIKGVQRTRDFVKDMMADIFARLGIDKVKGKFGYSFSRYTSNTTEVNKGALEANYRERVLAALQEILPPYISIELKASSSVAKEFGVRPDDDMLFINNSKETIKITKPRKTE